jgi:hypothetical protein
MNIMNVGVNLTQSMTGLGAGGFSGAFDSIARGAQQFNSVMYTSQAIAYGVKSAFDAIVGSGIEVNAQIEAQTFTMTSLLNATLELRNARGGLLNEQDKFNESMLISNKLVEQFRRDALVGAGTTNDRLGVAATTIGAFTQAGGELDKFAEFTNRAVSVGTTLMGGDIAQTARDAARLIRGEVGMDIQLYTRGFNKMVEDIGGTNAFKALGAPERLSMVMEFMKKYAPDTMIKEQGNSWAGLSSTMQEFMDMGRQIIGEPSFEFIKTVMMDIRDSLITADGSLSKTALNIRANLTEMGEDIAKALKWAYTNGIPFLVEFGKAFSKIYNGFIAPTIKVIWEGLSFATKLIASTDFSPFSKMLGDFADFAVKTLGFFSDSLSKVDFSSFLNTLGGFALYVGSVFSSLDFSSFLNTLGGFALYVGSVFSSLDFSSALNSLGGFAQSIFDILSGIDLTSFFDSVGGAFNGLFQTIGGFDFAALSSYYQEIAQTIVGILNSPELAQLGAAIVTSLGAAVQTLMGLRVAFMPIGQAIWETFSKIAPVALQVGSFILETVVPAFFELVNAGGRVASSLFDALYPTFSAIIDVLLIDAVPALMQFVGFIANNVVPIIVQSFDWLSQNVIPFFGEVIGWVFDGAMQIVSIFGGVFGEVSQGIANWITQNQPLIDGMAHGFEVIGQVVGWLWGNIFAPFIQFMLTQVIPSFAALIAQDLGNMFTGIGQAVEPVIIVMMTLFDWIGKVADFFGQMGKIASDVFGAIGSAVEDSFIGKHLKELFSGGFNPLGIFSQAPISGNVTAIGNAAASVDSMQTAAANNSYSNAQTNNFEVTINGSDPQRVVQQLQQQSSTMVARAENNKRGLTVVEADG